MQELDLNREFSILLSLVCESIAEFRHYDLATIAVSISPSKGDTKFGVWAYVVPLRHIGGKAHRRGLHRGLPGLFSYENPAITQRHPKALYLMTFLVPKFFRLSPRERLETLVHELYHLHPTLRGDLRRFSPPHIYHGPTPAQFKRKVKDLSEEAMKNFPEILAHPLLAGEIPEEKQRLRRRHFAIPKQVFKPLVFFPLLLMCLTSPIQAQEVNVRSNKETSVYASPGLQAQTLGIVGPDMMLKATKLNADRTWVFVKGPAGEGWIQRHLLNTVTSEGNVPPVPSAVSGDEEFSKEPMPRKEAALPASAEVLRQLQFFAEPSVKAKRFGLLEKGDEVKIIEANPERDWIHVNLSVTGEEGWVPSGVLRLPDHKAAGALEEEEDADLGLDNDLDAQSVSSRQKPLRKTALGTELSYSSKDVGFGVGAHLETEIYRQRALNPRSIRLNAGLHGGYHFGTVVEDTDVPAEFHYRYFLLGAEVRALKSELMGPLGLALGLGVAYLQPMVSGTNTDTNESVEADSETSDARFGWSLSGAVFYPLEPWLQLDVGSRVYFMKSQFVSVYGGATWLF